MDWSPINIVLLASLVSILLGTPSVRLADGRMLVHALGDQRSGIGKIRELEDHVGAVRFRVNAAGSAPMTLLMVAGIAVILLAATGGLLRVLLGAHMVERMLAAQLLGTCLVGLLALAADAWERNSPALTVDPIRPVAHTTGCS